jgi:hypothetical protein
MIAADPGQGRRRGSTFRAFEPVSKPAEFGGDRLPVDMVGLHHQLNHWIVEEFGDHPIGASGDHDSFPLEIFGQNNGPE